MRLAAPVILLFLCWTEINAQQATSRQSVKFMGRDVMITEPELQPDGYHPKGPASVCLGAPSSASVTRRLSHMESTPQ